MLVFFLAFLIFVFGLAGPISAASYNTASGIVVDKAVSQAVGNSPVLVACEEEPKLCAEPEGPGNSQNAPVGPPGGGPGPHGRHK